MNSTQTKQRFILTQLNEITLVFPAAIVAEIIIIEKEQILSLPFYNPAVMGCFYCNGRIVPLVSLHQIMGVKMINTKKLTVVSLNEKAGKQVTGIGLVVERIIGSQNQEQLPPNLFNTDQESSRKMRLFRPEIINSEIWQPQLWQSN